MVEAQRQVRHRPDGDRVVDDDGPLLDRADAEDRHLRLVDDRHAELRAELARVRDGERPAVHLLGLELLRARALGDVGDGAAQAEQVLLVGVLDHRDDQPALERHRDAEVHVLLVDDVVAVERRVDDRMPPHRVDHRLGDERHVRQLGAEPLVFRLLLLADPSNGREVDVKDGVHVRRGAPAQHHVLGDLLAHHRERLDLDSGRWRRAGIRDPDPGPASGSGSSRAGRVRGRRAFAIPVRIPEPVQVLAGCRAS